MRLCEYVADPATVISSLGSALLNEVSALCNFHGITALDPFAGGGSIPVEALRLGVNAIAGEYNPLAALYLRYLLEWGCNSDHSPVEEAAALLRSVLIRSRENLDSIYPSHPSLGQPVGYIRFRQLVCEGPGCGSIVPATSKFELNCRDKIGLVFSNDLTPGAVLTMHLTKVPKQGFPQPTIRSGGLNCPACHFTTKRAHVMRQCADRVLPPLLVAAVYRQGSTLVLHTPTAEQIAADKVAARRLIDTGLIRLIPPQEWPKTEMRRFSPPLYGLKRFADCHTQRQQCFLAMLVQALSHVTVSGRATVPSGLASILMANAAEANTSFCRWRNDRGGSVEGTFAGKSIGMIWDFFEADPLHPSHYLTRRLDELVEGLYREGRRLPAAGTVLEGPVQELPLPDDSVDAIYTDPPYYDSIPYAHLSDWPLVWVKRLGTPVVDASGDADGLSPKSREIVVDRPHSKSPSTHDDDYFRAELRKGLTKCQRLLKEDGIAIIVFAHLKTSAWESLLESLLEAGFLVTASWPVVTERGGRLQAQNTASLQSSVHLVVRPKKGKDDSVGDWRDVLMDLPQRITEWLPRLAAEGVVGADAIFACIGPALEVFSRYSRVEKASGEQVLLRDYLEHVWAAISKEALGMIFSGGDATGFEEDARLTAMWLWTLVAPTTGATVGSPEANEEPTPGSAGKTTGYTMEYDAARKIAQGLGAHLEKLTDVIEVKGDKARLLAVSERTKALFGKDQADAPKSKRKKAAQRSLFSELDEAEAADGGWGEKSVSKVGETVLDRLHQSMILFAAGRSEAMRRFLVEEGIGRDQRFWRLAQALSALYPTGTDEKRWVDGVLARKKGLGF